jgi:uncharacterized protein YacL
VSTVGSNPPEKNPPGEWPPREEPSREPEGVDKIKTVGGLVAVVVGVVAVVVIAVVAIAENTSTSSTIASATAGVIATIVGAYFGMKIGSDQSKTAHESQKAEAAKAQVFAAHLPPQEAEHILGLADDAAKKVLGK